MLSISSCLHLFHILVFRKHLAEWGLYNSIVCASASISSFTHSPHCWTSHTRPSPLCRPPACSPARGKLLDTCRTWSYISPRWCPPPCGLGSTCWGTYMAWVAPENEGALKVVSTVLTRTVAALPACCRTARAESFPVLRQEWDPSSRAGSESQSQSRHRPWSSPSQASHLEPLAAPWQCSWFLWTENY